MTSISAASLEDQLAHTGFAFLPATQARQLLEAAGSLDDWPQFAASWDDLAVDTYMADGGRYRRRRHATHFAEKCGTIIRQPHQPHYQGLNYNSLNGGIERWFEPVAAEAGASRSMATILRCCHSCFGALSPQTKTWHVEVHQFRIDARKGEQGKPTPEGPHRDGVDYVLVLLVKRANIVSGTTTIADLEHRPLGSFTLTEPFDAAFVDDARVFHGVTPVEPLDAGKAAFRDVLVVTFRRIG